MKKVTGGDIRSPSQSRGAASDYTGHLLRPTSSSFPNRAFLGLGWEILTGDWTGPQLAEKLADFLRLSFNASPIFGIIDAIAVANVLVPNFFQLVHIVDR